MKPRKSKKRTLIIGLFLSFALSLQFILSTEVTAGMFGILKKYDVHLSPDVYGKITLMGKPLAGVEVLRGLTYGGEEELVDKTETDQSGFFFLKEKSIRSRKPGLIFNESLVKQVVIARYENKEYMLWYTHTIGIQPNLALSEKLKQLNCELTDSEEESVFASIEYPNANYLVHSICRWEP